MNTTTVTVPVEDWVIREIVDDLGWEVVGRSYTASATWADEQTLRVEVEGEGAAFATIPKLVETLGKIASGETEASDYAQRAAIDYLFEPTSADGDAEFADLLIQLAAFGEVIYG